MTRALFQCDNTIRNFANSILSIILSAVLFQFIVLFMRSVPGLFDSGIMYKQNCPSLCFVLVWLFILFTLIYQYNDKYNLFMNLNF